MIWLSITRVGTILSVVAASLELYNLFLREIKPNRIYTSGEAARYLGVNRSDVVDLVRNKKLHGKLVAGNYRIPGQSLLEYLNK
ncbi:MAG: helix-turn-helix domain-containing protein [Alphaproteobacteria bacterium]|nr:helix-turn-helix domain-containing protein [Alphaproteobacteria bacterium]